MFFPLPTDHKIHRNETINVLQNILLLRAVWKRILNTVRFIDLDAAMKPRHLFKIIRHQRSPCKPFHLKQWFTTYFIPRTTRDKILSFAEHKMLWRTILDGIGPTKWHFKQYFSILWVHKKIHADQMQNFGGP
jgi:hypothetical protein